ncbi:unnamed protein product [Kuraishia capsulata CBS 1993]|uniref:Amidohydrolase-related domain-containing protein n=1 Tax=Kuraishia capsulata CBS 1993 TaxID=1382522 RepID=W6MKK0_9ASCO|nr:uncharacterized protein KUCA_T00001219001 [Kuraishia capsulata CBS 1993]CDK25252.1 unnamed protein product [Kuraishia capsulata CBS 1993]
MYQFPNLLESKAKKPLTFTVYHGNFVHTPVLGELQVLLGARIAVDKSGVIVYIKTSPLKTSPIQEAMALNPSLPRDEIRCIDTMDDTSKVSKFWFPGFIDTHIHAPQFPNNGVFGSSTTVDWLLKYTFPMEKLLGADLNKCFEVYDKVVKRTLANGTTCCAYYATIDVDATNLLADCCYSNGQRAYIGRSCMDCAHKDYTDESAEEGVKATYKVMGHISNRDFCYDLIKPIITPRNANRCSGDYMKRLGLIAKVGNLPLQYHMSETGPEAAKILEQFPERKSYADIYDYHDLLTSSAILGHCIYISQEELDLINERKAAISHCPISNSCLISGECKVRWLLDNGTKVGLGTDISGGYSASILATARHAHMVSRHVAMKTKELKDTLSVNEVLFLGTQGGAQAMGLQDMIGSFDVGKKWECQLIDLEVENSPVDLFDFLTPKLEKSSESDPQWMSTFQDMIDRWVFNGDDRNVRQVYVNGRCVIDKDKTYEEVMPEEEGVTPKSSVTEPLE